MVEMVHAATLVHDDVIDAAQKTPRWRRQRTWHRPSTHLPFWQSDRLYMQAFQIALRERNFQILDLLIGLTQMMVEERLIQLERIGRIDVTRSGLHGIGGS